MEFQVSIHRWFRASDVREVGPFDWIEKWNLKLFSTSDLPSKKKRSKWVRELLDQKRNFKIIAK
ncbi:hypothetical protein [Cohaesibacter intestini]|uniref:hypothetical protein n=1 Tax=Cohaesibacter intestini TaxID=2211145 RepID=UPI00130069D7|nr:hypothetical protein [Cohaesibacter intestini]